MTRPAFDVVVVGGGLAGSAAAITLATQGCKVALVEKEALPRHKVCGEFLSQEALTYLQRLGVDVAALGAVPITSVRLAGHWGVTESKLPFLAASLTRRCLDEALLTIAARSGASVIRGLAVHSVDGAEDAWRIALSDSSTVNGSMVFIASGKHDLRGRTRPKGVQSDLIALKMYWRLAPLQRIELGSSVELHLYRGGYGGLQPVEGGLANLCCLVRRETFQRLGGRWETLLKAMQSDCPLLARRLLGAEPILDKPLAISPIPYGFVRESNDGVWSLGDQAAVIPSFTGDGMSIALHSGLLAARMYLQGKTAGEFQMSMHNQVKRQVSLATTLSRGMVREPQRSLMMAVAKLWPGALRVVADRTRIPTGAVNSVTQPTQKPVASDAASMGCY